MKIKIKCKINGKEEFLVGHSISRMVDILRENNFFSVKIGCGEGECGSCAISFNNKLVNSCLLPLGQVEGSEIYTLEGLNDDFLIKNIQRSFLKNGGTQCGACTPGMILAIRNLLIKNKKPSRNKIVEALSGNICRCTGYVKIVDSVMSICILT